MLRGLHHIGIAVKNLDQAMKNYVTAFGVPVKSIHEAPQSGVRFASLSVGNSELELLEPIGTEGIIAKFLASHGEGIHHICLEVDDINQTLKHLSAKGIALRDKEPREAAIGKIAFLYPEGMNGVTIELVEKASVK